MPQLLLSLDQAENATNSQRTQDCFCDSDVVADADPVEGQDDDRANDDYKIEHIPVVSEIFLLLSDYLDNGFNGEYAHEDVIHDIDWVFVGFGLHIPVEAEDEGVGNDADHDEHVEVAMFGQ